MQDLNIDDVDKTMDEISEAQDQMQQMNDVLSQPIGTAADLDEDELAAELAVCFKLLHIHALVQGSPFVVAAMHLSVCCTETSSDSHPSILSPVY